MGSDSEEDEIFDRSVFADGAISKGDLVWASLENGEDSSMMWPAQVTSVNKKAGITVKMLGRPMKVITVKECIAYSPNAAFELAAHQSIYWDNAVTKLKQLMDLETNGIFNTSEPSTSVHSLSKPVDSGKRRKLSQSSLKNVGYVIGDIVWAKYRNHPIWPAKVNGIEKNGYFMIRYLEFDDLSIKTSTKNISHFDCSDYISNVEAGINSPMSPKFKVAYKNAHQQYIAQNSAEEEVVPLIPVFSDGLSSIEELAIASPRKGKNQLVHFIHRNTDMFQKIIQGKLVGHFQKEFIKKNSAVTGNGGLFGSYAKTELEEERVLEAIGLMQHKLSKKNELSQTYGLNVMLPEAIVRFIMLKKKLSYRKAKAIYEIDVKKVKKKDKLTAREALLNAPVTQEAKDEFEKLSQLRTQKFIEDLNKFSSGKKKCRRKVL